MHPLSVLALMYTVVHHLFSWYLLFKDIYIYIIQNAYFVLDTLMFSIISLKIFLDVLVRH